MKNSAMTIATRCGVIAMRCGELRDYSDKKTQDDSERMQEMIVMS